MAGSVFAAYGAFLVNEKGDVTVRTDATRQVLDWFKRLSKHLPEEVYAYDNASNNKALISGYSALIMNPPSAYAVAKRDAPKVAEQLWAFHSPKGPNGRYDPSNPYFWGIWNFSKNIPAAKALLAHISQREIQEKLVTASVGFDVPAQLVVGAVLHRMRDEDQSGIGAERFRLRLRSLNKLGRRDADRRNATLLKVRHVMRTARYARASVAEAFDDEIDFAHDLLLQRQGSGPRVGRLPVALHRDAELLQPLVEAIEEYVTPRLRDIENTDRQAVEFVGPRQPRPYRRTSFRCRVEKHCHLHLLCWCHDKGCARRKPGSSGAASGGRAPGMLRLNSP